MVDILVSALIGFIAGLWIGLVIWKAEKSSAEFWKNEYLELQRKLFGMRK